MSPNKFDRHIKAKLQDHHKAIDAEEMWAAIEPQRPQRRWGIWWLFGLLLPIGLAGYVWQQDLMSTSEETVSQVIKLDEQAVSKVNKEIDQVTFDQNEIQREEERGKREESSIRAFTLTPKPYLRKEERGKPALSTAEGRKEESIPASTLTLTPKPYLREEDRARISGLHTQTQTQIHTITTALPNKEIMALPIPALAFEATPTVPLEEEDFDSEKSNGLYLDLRAGLYAPVRTLEFGSDSSSMEEETLFNERRNSESTLEAWSVDLNFGYQHASGWYVQSGIGYSQLIEQFEYSEMTMVRDSVPGIVRMILESNGDTTFVEGQVERTQTSTFYQVNYNSFRSLDIPVLFGYQFGKDRFGLMAEGGFRINIQQEQEGVRRGVGGTIIDIADHPDLRTQLGLSLQAGIGVNWQFTPAISLSANTSIRYFTGDLSKKGTVIRERYQWLGGQVGLRWYF